MARTILIVDDLEINRQILREMLCNDYNIIEAASGKEALDYLLQDKSHISAILLDIIIPDIDGFNILRQIRTNPDISQIPVIMITGSEDAELRINALALGANDFITKPYNPDIIKHCLYNNIALQESANAVITLQRDKLTGLYGREAFFAKVTQMVSSHEPGYYIMASFDISKLKVINDQYGVTKGDEILRHVASVFKNGFEAHGGICCRIAADDFAILYPASFQDSAEIANMRLRATHISGLASPITFCIGRYTVVDHSMAPDAMYDRAVLAADTIKGRYDTNIATYDESMHSRLIYEQELVTEMEAALLNHQFEVWFQPQYNHSTGALIGAEALVRWRHPKKGMIPPASFIPVFEQNGFIYPLDNYVWEEVCRYLRKWIDEGTSPLPVSVNISRYDALRPDIVETITGLIDKYELSTDLLRLEITESAFTESTNHIVDVVKELISCGFTVEIDDFGSGYSSLNTLKSVPAQIVKLDMRFFEEGDDSQRSGNIIESVVRMTKWLGMSVIAEGVETIEDADFLKSIGCNYIQGYLYAKPMPAKSYEALCSDTKKEEKLITLDTVENLDNNSFWDPKSMDTLIFNSFVGGACIYEYHHGNIELLRATEKYAQVISSAGMTVEDALKLNWVEHLDEDNRKKVMANLNKSIANKKEVSGEYVFLDLPGCPHKTYLRSAMRVIASVGDRHLVYCTNENITAQRDAELREERLYDQLQTIMNRVNGGISAIKLDSNSKGHVIFANDKYYTMFGYTEEQIRTELSYISDVIHPDDLPGVQDEINSILADHLPREHEYRCIKRDGSIIYVRGSKSLANIDGYGDDVLISVVTDITDIILVERRAQKLSEQMQAIMDNIDIGITATGVNDENIEYIFANDRYYENLGYTREQFQQEVKDPFLTVDSEYRQHLIAAIDRVLDTRKSEVIEYRTVLRDGSFTWMRTILSYGSFADIDKPILLATYRDTTEEKITEQKERRTSEQLQAIMSDIDSGITATILKNDKVEFLFSNDRYYEIHGYTREQYHAEVNDDFALISPDDRENARRAVLKAYTSHKPARIEYRIICRDGSLHWVRVDISSTHFTDIEENVHLCIFTDITSERELGRELLDNLPYGAALYEFDGKSLSVIHLNKRYWELVRRKSIDNLTPSFIDAVYPDDRAVISRELAAAIRQERDAVCDLRILCGENEYRPFHIAGRIVPKGDGIYAVYAAYTPISNEAMSYQQMLPILLTTIMDSTTDLSFAKDKDFRYICASQTFASMAGCENANDLIGKTDYDLFERQIADKYRHDDESLLRDGTSLIDMVEEIPSADGTPHYSNTSKYLLRDAGGNIIGLYGIGRDITEYRDAFSKLKLLTNSIPGGLATYECSPDHIRMIYCNDGFCRLFELSPAEHENISEFEPVKRIFREDQPLLMAQKKELLSNATPLDCTYRIHTKDGRHRWISHKAVAADYRNNTVVVNALFQDVTKQHELTERLRLSEEESNLAILLSGNIIAHYNVADDSMSLSQEAAASLGLPEKVSNVLSEPVRCGMISPDTADAYTTFFEAIRNGERTATAVFRQKYMHEWQWTEAKSSTLFSYTGEPVRAVISFSDVTDRLEKEAVYNKWQQSLHDKEPESYMLFRCNISQNTSFDSASGFLLNIEYADAPLTFDERTAEYVEQCVYDVDKDKYIEFVSSDRLLAAYYRGKRSDYLEYREMQSNGDTRWLRLSIDLVEYPSSTDIEAYLLYENIDTRKQSELHTMEMAETDPLTGVFNRTAFASRVEEAISSAAPGIKHALIMIDIDGFKRVNDAFGHSTGDQVLIEITDSLRSTLRPEDLVGRLGGDELMVFLNDMPDNNTIESKAKHICALTRKSFSLEVQISASVGIARSPNDGTDFETLYKKADLALYYVKGSGKDNYALYYDHMDDEHLVPEADTDDHADSKQPAKKRRMLIVDDNMLDYQLLANIFKEDFIVEKTKDGNSALIRLRHYKSAISVVLLDLMMPGMDGFTVLKNIRQSAELQSIPVIIVSGDDSRETCLRTIRDGATDFITKPIDPELLRIRVNSAISQSENERLRVKNNYLEIRNDERIRYETALEGTGLAVIEYDWLSGGFIYYPSISKHIAGNFDDRNLWQILLSDLVADTLTVQDMQALTHRIAEDRTLTYGNITVELKAPDKCRHRFRMNVRKLTDEFQLTNKLMITLLDLDYNGA